MAIVIFSVTATTAAGIVGASGASAASGASGASSVLTATNVQSVLGWANSLTGIVSSVVASPWAALIGVAGVALIGGLVWWFLGSKITAYLIEIAQKKTEQNKTDFLKDEVPTNAAAGQADNTTQSNIENKT